MPRSVQRSPAALADLGDGLVVVPAGETWLLDADTGAIDAYGAPPIAPGAEPTRGVREAGAGAIDGIAFELADQEGGATPHGVFSFDALTIPEGAAVTATGAAALVLVARDSVDVAGELSVAAAPFGQPPDTTTDWALMSGPGGAAGGVRCSEETSPGLPGGGAGGGGFGAAVGGERTQGGGGGASFGGGGGGLGGTGIPGGAPGATYGSVSLVPFEGGSGGAILLEAPAVTVSRGLQRNGGGGGAGCPVNDPDARGFHGAHGSDGPAAAGGAGTGVGGGGGVGSDIEGGAGAGAQDQNGGGGGGGGGLIRVNADPGGATLDTSVPHAPSVASGLMSVGVVARVP